MKRRAASAPKAGGKKVRGKVDKDGKFSTGEVHEDYDCILIRTNIKKNINRLYIIRVTASKSEEKTIYYSWSRFARVGKMGEYIRASFVTLEEAIKDFEEKFKNKTKNLWADRMNFVYNPGKYTLIEVEGEQDAEVKVDHVNEDIQERFLDIKNLTKKQIKKGIKVLEEIEDAMNQSIETGSLEELSSKFYSTIPHNFGMTIPPTIESEEIVQQKKKMLKVVEDMENAQKLKSETEKAQEEMTVTVPDPVDQN